MTLSVTADELKYLFENIFGFVTKLFYAIKQFFQNAFGKDDGTTNEQA